MTVRALGRLLMAVSILAIPLLPPAVQPVRAAEYTLETEATYDVRPAGGRIAVTIDVTFTNTTPDPEGRFSVFEELRLAIHQEATNLSARDRDAAGAPALRGHHQAPGPLHPGGLQQSAAPCAPVGRRLSGMGLRHGVRGAGDDPGRLRGPG